MEAVEELGKDEIMKHLMNALDRGQDIGHYGRLVFIMGARHLLDKDELLAWMIKDEDCDEAKARSLIEQVEQRNYNPRDARGCSIGCNGKDFRFAPTRMIRIPAISIRAWSFRTRCMSTSGNIENRSQKSVTKRDASGQY